MPDCIIDLKCPHCSERAVTLAPTGEFVCFACYGSGYADPTNGIVISARTLDQRGKASKHQP